jgi:hypothetical protein
MLLRLFYIWCFSNQPTYSAEPHSRRNRVIGLNKPLINPDFVYSSENSEKGNDFRFPKINSNNETHDFANKIIKNNQLNELIKINSLINQNPLYKNSITHEYVKSRMNYIDETITIHNGQTFVLNEGSNSIPVPSTSTIPPFICKKIHIEPLNRPSIYSVKNIQKGGLLDDFNKDI